MGGIEIFSDKDYFLYGTAQLGIGYALTKGLARFFSIN